MDSSHVISSPESWFLRLWGKAGFQLWLAVLLVAVASREPVSTERVESILILGMASPFSPPSSSFSWLTLLWPFVGPSGEWVFSCVRSVVVKQSADELRRNSTVNNLHFSHLSLFFNNVAVMLRWGRRYRHVSDALVVLSMIMNGTWSASRSACCKLGLILFPFLLVARLCCLSLDHLHVGYHSDTKDILSPPGPPPSWICWN